MKESGQTEAVFGRRREPHTIIIARGDSIRHFTIRPWVAALAGSALSAVAIGYLLATSYLVLRDDLIGATVARQARMQQAYEDRISALRAQVDRITSRQLLDQQLMEGKVAELIERQNQLTQRHGRLDPILDRASGEKTLPDAAPVPVPAARPGDRADAGKAGKAFDVADGGSSRPFAFWQGRDARPESELSDADHADRLFVEINRSLRTIETDQIARIDRLSENAYQTADAITAALRAAGLPVAEDFGKADVGGPLIPADGASMFDAKVKELDEALDSLETLKEETRKLPIANPAPGQPVTSAFGVRSDPLLGGMALHSGMDFRSAVGSPARATGAGVVVKAGWNGGYGRMVEIDHGHGLSTRYAHLAAILVKEGDVVATGDEVGETGSSGRSTGPHLHYEVRKDGEAVDPLGFIRAGSKIRQYL